MKKTLLSSFLMAAVVATASAEVKVTVTPIGERPEVENNRPNKIVSTADLLVNEDFSGFKAGSETAPDYSNPIAAPYVGSTIDPSYTKASGWTGSNVYSAGGAIALSTDNMYYRAYIATPANDYSGSVKMTFLAKYEYVEFEDGEGNVWHWSGSSARVSIENPDGDRFDVGDETDYNLADVRLYKDQGWCEITLEFDNFTAYNNASIVIWCDDAILVDDVRITSSVDNFIAPPVIKNITDVTETSFTINFEPVRKAYNYYTYLYTLEGYDEAGEPIYMPVLDPETMEFLEQYGMTVEEYLELAEMDKFDVYLNYGAVEQFEPTCFTFEGLDPEVDYYWGVRSHFVYTFSDLYIYPANVIAAPKIKEATNIGKDYFTANWEPIAKADTYDVTLYGVAIADSDEPEFGIFEEYFDNTSVYTDSDNIFEPDIMDESNGVTIDDLTTAQGWTTNMKSIKIVDGKIGINGWGTYLTTPSIFVANSDYIRVSMRVEATMEEDEFSLSFAGIDYTASIKNGVFEAEFDLETNGIEEGYITIGGASGSVIFVDYIYITQSIKKGNTVYYTLETVNVDNSDLSLEFNNLDTDNYQMFGYSVKAVRGEGLSTIKSENSERIVVDLEGNNSWSGLANIDVNNGNIVEVARYTIDGKLINEPQRGINIVRYSDGSVRKIMVK